MDTNLGASGFLKIGNEADRNAIAAILYRNGYTVSPTRKKRDGKSYEYYVKYEMRPRDIPGNEDAEYE